MLHISRDNVVTDKVADTDVELGTISRNEDTGGWQASCALCDFGSIRSRRGAAAHELDEHFRNEHTTS